MNEHFITVIIPVYNGEQYIKRAIDSILVQTYSNYEIIIINDGSTDNTLKILEEYNNPKIKVINKINEGQGIARNIGLGLAQGEYIFFLDADDYVEKEMFEEMISKINEYKVDTCVCNWKTIFENGKTEKHDLVLEEGLYCAEKIRSVILKNILCSDMKNGCETSIGISVTKALYSVKIIKENNIKFSSERKVFSEDLIFNFNYYKYCKNMYIIDKCFYNYVILKQSYSHNYQENYLERAKQSYEYLMKNLNDIDNDDDIRISLRFLSYVVVCLKQERYRDKNVRMQNIKKICNDEVVEEALKKVKTFRNLKLKKLLIYKLLRYKKYNLINFIIVR